MQRPEKCRWVVPAAEESLFAVSCVYLQVEGGILLTSHRHLIALAQVDIKCRGLNGASRRSSTQTARFF